ncbi:glutamate racemase [Thermodesulfobacteriota bacterium]
MKKKKPIGVFDSGVGGLSVLQSIREELPCEDLIYVADSGYAPYGEKPPNIVEERSVGITGFLVESGVKAVVVACNTATAVAVSILRSRFSLPIIAMEPAVKPAVKSTRSGVVGIMATEGTLKSTQFATLLEQFGNSVQVIKVPCRGLVEKVEEAELTSRGTRKLLENYLVPLMERGVDTIVLGCTHYPFLNGMIKDIVGPDIELIDTAEAVARHLRRRLETENLINGSLTPGLEVFWTSEASGMIREVISRLWKGDVEVKNLPAHLL